jgi:GNAT superfamily N-acetyltransferase
MSKLVSGNAFLVHEKWREPAIELVNQFFTQINTYQLDGYFQVKPRAATKMVDVYLKLAGSEKALFLGWENESELKAIILARIEEKPFLREERVLYVDLAVTKRGARNQGYMKALLAYTEEWARKKNIYIIELRALIENEPAIRYWRKQGYKDFYIRFRKKI